ncbi:MAG: phosphoenolpyruvate--protein phosphotransferase [bacterium]|nr:phosphoenolpyruvate--protein phosphotransferase [bacterium]
MEITLRGIGVSPGIAIGPALTFGVQTLDIPEYQVDDKRAELGRFEEAVESVRADLKRLHEVTSQKLGAQHADIFTVHLMLLEDVTLREEIEQHLESERMNIEYLLNDLIARYSKVMESLDDPSFRERGKDLVDVGQRLLSKLLNTDLETLEHLDRPSVVVAHDLAPSDTAKVDLVNTLGIATDVSGPTSHTAILARAFELPAVVGLKYVGAHTLPGDTVIVDGTRGEVILRPDEKTLARFIETKKREDQRRKALLAAETRPSATEDGHEVPTYANIELPVEVSHSLKANALGIGLYRTEYLFLNRITLPTEDEQYEAYVEVAEALKPAPVTLRTLDLGGDKFASHLRLAEEINPQLGWRAIRFCLERPDIFKAQLRAMLRASVQGNVQIMFPLISGLDEMLRVKEVVRQVMEDLDRRGVEYDRDIKVGTMIEVPSAVEVAPYLAKVCDFFSIGTNDLIQYSLAVDRINEKIAHMYEPAHPAVLSMIARTVKAAKAERIDCGICGEMAGDPVFTELLVGLGVTSLSMSSVAIPAVRAELSSLRMTAARRLTKRVLTMGSVSEIRALLDKRHEERRTIDTFLDGIEADAQDADAPESRE